MRCAALAVAALLLARIAPAAEGGRVFVSLALDPREAGSLRDAVAGLGAAVDFSADARFSARPGPGGTVLYSGWIPAARLGEAMSRPGVMSVRVENSPESVDPPATSGEFLVGLRVEDPVHAREAVAAGVRTLAASADFRLMRLVGLEPAPAGRSVAVVLGALPLSRLSRAMALPGVVKIVPVGGELPLPKIPAPRDEGLKGFFAFALQRWPLLIAGTLLLILAGLLK